MFSVANTTRNKKNENMARDLKPFEQSSSVQVPETANHPGGGQIDESGQKIIIFWENDIYM